ncbi:MAG: DUF2232 domain-containing protein, partial [Rhizobiales bacterium]|nr:DUF2232 domain-containing protein [Hyphomicrobiales bacterium]
MRTTYLVGAGLGLVAAVVFASATTGPMLARLLLMFITPLPIALAGLGWGWRAAMLAGVTGSALILAFTSPAVALAFAITQAAPMVLLTYLALLSRPIAGSGVSEGGDVATVEWYPVGRIVLWSAVLAGLMAVAMLMIIGGDLETLRRTLGDFIKTTFEAGLAQTDGKAQFSEAEIAAISEIALSVLPGASAMSWMGSLLFNLWLAGRVTNASGQLGRPWPDLAALTFPAGTPLAFGVTLLATMLAGYPGLAAAAFAGGLFLAYLLLGLAILHYTTRGQPWRPIALWLLYGTLLVVNIWIAIVIVLLGLA